MIGQVVAEATQPPNRPEGMGWRVGVSIVASFGSLIAAIIWLFFFAGGFSVYQNIALVVVVFLVFVAVMGATWASWGMRQADRWDWGQRRTSGRASHEDGVLAVGGVVLTGWDSSPRSKYSGRQFAPDGGLTRLRVV